MLRGDDSLVHDSGGCDQSWLSSARPSRGAHSRRSATLIRNQPRLPRTFLVRYERTLMAIYQSMQRVRFASPDDYRKFLAIFADTRNHLKELSGFLHLTWWVHADDP